MSARVTVLLPVHDSAPFLAEAVDSILGQSWTDLELLIVDDGSSDGSGAIADGYAMRDQRVRVDHLPHRGLVAALNHGMDTIDSELIARADADDVNHRDRLARQIRFLDARPEVGVCGTWLASLPPGSRWKLDECDEDLRALLLFGCPFHHPTVMLRREWIARSELRYDPAFIHAEDYDLWERAARETRFGNVPAVLVRYRKHAAQMSVVHGEAQAAHSRAVRLRQLQRLGISPTPAEIELHEEIVASAPAPERARLDELSRWLERLGEANRAVALYPEPAFSRLLARRWHRVCVAAARAGVSSASLFARSSLTTALRPKAWQYRLYLHAVRALHRG